MPKERKRTMEITDCKRALLRVLCISGLLLALAFAAGGPQAAFADTEGVLTYTLSGGNATITDCVATAEALDVSNAFEAIAQNCTVTAIGAEAFSYCTELTSIDIPESVISIGAEAFYRCTGLAGSLTIPAGVTSIGYNAFRSCLNLASIKIPASVTSIGSSAFYGCTELTSIDIPVGVTDIGYNAFYGCTGLTSIDIPESVTTIGDGPFASCSNLKTITVDSENQDFMVDAYGALLDMAQTRLIQLPAAGGLTGYTIPESVTDIGNEAFFECAGLTAVDIPVGVIRIGYRAFYGCAGLTAIDIPNGVWDIGYQAFGGTGIAGISVPASVLTMYADTVYQPDGKSILCGPFSDMGSLTTVVFNHGIGRTNIPENALVGIFPKPVEVYVPISVTSVNQYAFGFSYPPSKNLTICGVAESYIETWAEDNNVPFKSINFWITKSDYENAWRLVPYQYIIETNTPENAWLSFEVVGGGLPAGLELLQDGQFHGAPLETGDFSFHVAVRFNRFGGDGGKEYLMDLQEIKLRVEEPGDAQLAATNDYKVSDFVGEPAVPGVDGDYVLRGDRAVGGLADQIFIIADSSEDLLAGLSNYRYFVDFWLDGRRLTRGPATNPNAEYDARDGSTVVTVYAKTFQSLDNGPHTIAAEFMVPAGPAGGPPEQRVSAQKFTLELTGERPPGGYPPAPAEPSRPSGPSGGGSSVVYTPPQAAEAAGAAGAAPATGETQISTPDGSPPVRNEDGSLTLPSGGTVTLPVGVTVEAPAGTTVDAGGAVRFPEGSGGTATLPGGVTVEAPASTTVDAGGAIRFPEDAGGTARTPGGVVIALPSGALVESGGTMRVPAGSAGATVSYADGSTAFVPAGYMIEILDPDSPLASALGIAWDNPFGDVDAGAWYYADVAYVCGNGLMNGTSATGFSPGAPMTRGMLVTVLHRAAGSPAPPEDGGAAFTDLPAGAYYAEAAAWAAASGILAGAGEGLAAPLADISRQDLAALLARYAEFADKAPPAVRPAAGFADEAGVADYAREAVQALAAAGVLNGRPGNIFDPQGNATRAEAAAVLHRFLEAVE
jgi:hypothetical protein